MFSGKCQRFLPFYSEALSSAKWLLARNQLFYLKININNTGQEAELAVLSFGGVALPLRKSPARKASMFRLCRRPPAFSGTRNLVLRMHRTNFRVRDESVRTEWEKCLINPVHFYHVFNTVNILILCISLLKNRRILQNMVFAWHSLYQVLLK